MTFVTEEQRGDVTDRICKNLEAMVFFNGLVIDDVPNKAKQVEMAALASANSAGSELDGLRTYSTKLGQQLVDILKGGGVASMDVDVPSAPSAERVFDLTSDTRELLTKERAEELLAPLFAKDANYTKVKLSTKSFGAVAAPVTAAALRNNCATLEELDLADILSGVPTAEARAALRTIVEGLGPVQLRSLDVSDNALGEVGVRALTSLLPHQTRLETLLLLNDGISAEAAAAVHELVANAPCATTLRTLHFFNNMSGDEGGMAMAALLKRCTNLEDFRMSTTRVMEDGGMALAASLGAVTSLRRLDLKDNCFSAPVGDSIARALMSPPHPNLTAVNCSELGLDNGGVFSIVTALAATAKGLSELQVAGNNVTGMGMMKIAPRIARMSALKALNVSENELGNRGALALAPALPAGLESLNACECQMSAEGAVALGRAMGGRAACKLVALNGNFIDEDGLDALAAAVPAAALGPLDDNDEEGEADDEEEEEEEDELEDLDDAAAEITIGMQSM